MTRDNSAHHILKTAKEETPALVSANSLALCSMPEARALLEYEKALGLRVLPLGIVQAPGGSILTAAHDGSNLLHAYQALQFSCGCQVRLVAVEPQVLDDAIFIAYNQCGEKLDRVFRADSNWPHVLQNPNLPPEFRGASGAGAQVLEALLDYAISRGASDVQIVPRENICIIRMRVDGRLVIIDDQRCTKPLLEQIIGRVRVLCRLPAAAGGVPQEGRFSVPLPGKQAHIRAAMLETMHGRQLSMRLLGTGKARDLYGLGFDRRTLQEMERIMHRGQGTVVFSGPTGSGKSTSLYALLMRLHVEGQAIISIEDPVEIQIPGISQVCLSSNPQLDFAAALKAALRHDPDAIMIGELRDSKSTQIAIDAALSGHIILTTVHARSCLDIVTRLARLGGNREALSRCLDLLVSQRLLPSFCEKCKVIDLQQSNRRKREVYQAVGCPSCDYSGVSGQVLVFESLSLDSEIRNRIAAGRLQTEDLFGALTPDNYSPLKLSVANRLKDGLISIKDAGAVVDGV